MSAALRVGILGAGNIGIVHLQSVAATDGATVAGAADSLARNRERARSLGADHVTEDYRTLLEEVSLDVAVVALPPALHADAAIAAMRAGCAVFIEKPLARSVAEADRVLAVADETGCAVGVDHTLRYQDDIRAVKEVYDDGRLGHVPLATITRVNNGPFASPPAEDPVVDWQLDPSATGGGALVDLGVHLFDVLEWLFGDMEVRHATLESQLDLPYEDTACVQLRSRATGTQATLQCGFFQWEDPPDVTGSLHLHGVAESVDSREFRPDSLVRHAAASALRNTVRRVLGRSPNYFEPTYYYRAHYRALSAFLDAVAAGEEPPVSGAEGRRTLELVEAAYDRAGTDAEAPSATEEVAWQD